MKTRTELFPTQADIGDAVFRISSKKSTMTPECVPRDSTDTTDGLLPIVLRFQSFPGTMKSCSKADGFYELAKINETDIARQHNE